MNKNQKLELTWIGKGDEPKLEPRILIEQPEYSYGDPNSGNILIHGDNLLALKALEQDFTGKIKCIYIDPPFNTGAAFEHYDDNLEHSIWLKLMKPRLDILKKLLKDDGSIYIHIDNNEQAYLKVLLDEIFGRSNFVQMISIKRASPAGFKVINPGPLTVTDYVLLYAKDKAKFSYYQQRIPVDYDENYNLYIENITEAPDKWRLEKLVDVLYQRYNLKDWKDARSLWGSNWKSVRSSLLGDVAVEMSDKVVSVRDPHKPSEKVKQAMAISKENPKQVIVLERENHSSIYFYNGGSLSFYKEKLRKITGKMVPTELLTDFWHDLNFAGIAKEGGVQFKNSKKPEMLIQRIIELSTKEHEIILDSFLGSGTTSAVAHKMGRKWIGIELGEHAITHCYPRLRKVIEGEQSGISKSVNWKGGGGFHFYTLAPSLLNKDKYGNWVISKEYNPDMLAAAMAKQVGFKYEPDEQIYWKQGKSSEKDFIFTTTRFITIEILDNIHDEMQAGESLLIACKAFQQECEFKFPGSITLKKIPQMLIGKCEFGKDDYSLNIVNLPGEYDKVIINETITDYEPAKEIENKGDDFPTNLFDQ